MSDTSTRRKWWSALVAGALFVLALGVVYLFVADPAGEQGAGRHGQLTTSVSLSRDDRSVRREEIVTQREAPNMGDEGVSQPPRYRRDDHPNSAEREGASTNLAGGRAPSGEDGEVQPPPITATQAGNKPYVRIEDILVPLEPGKKYRILSLHGSEYPRPLTPNEQERLADLSRQLHESYGLDKETRRNIAREVDSLTGLTLPPHTHETIVWIPVPDRKRPPDSEAIVIDLRNR
jgi:hypothetical protein